MSTKEELLSELKQAEEKLRDFESSWEGMSGYEVSVATTGIGGDGWAGLTVDQIEEHDRQREPRLRYYQSRVDALREKLKKGEK